MRLVFDACALIALIKRESGFEVVLDLLVSNENDCFVHGANLCEVFYEVIREANENRAENVIDDLLSMGLQLRHDMDKQFWQQAGRHKAKFRRISLADCFCASLAERLSAEVVTADRREFEPLVDQMNCNIRFIR